MAKAAALLFLAGFMLLIACRQLLSAGVSVLQGKLSTTQLKLTCAGGGVITGAYFLLQAGDITFRSCSSKGRGGCLHVGRSLQQTGGLANFHGCTASEEGGGLLVKGFFSQANGSASFIFCKSSKSGGGMQVIGDVNLGGSIKFSRCVAGDEGWASATVFLE